MGEKISLCQSLSDKMKAGLWNPRASDAQKNLVDIFEKKYDLK